MTYTDILDYVLKNQDKYKGDIQQLIDAATIYANIILGLILGYIAIKAVFAVWR